MDGCSRRGPKYTVQRVFFCWYLLGMKRSYCANVFPITKEAKYLRLGRATLADVVALLDALALAAAGVEALEAGALFGFGHGCRLVGAINLVSLSVMLAKHAIFYLIFCVFLLRRRPHRERCCGRPPQRGRCVMNRLRCEACLLCCV